MNPVLAVIGACVSLAGLALGIVSCARSQSTENEQKRLQGRLEESSLVPVLAEGVEPAKRRTTVTLHTVVGKVVKPANAPVFKDGRRLLIVPVWNVGNGLAVWRKTQVLTDCGKAFKSEFEKRPKGVRRLGFYNVPAGLSEQIGHQVTRPDDKAAAAAAARKNALSVFVLYTDVLDNRDRASCMDFTRGSPKRPWSLSTQKYLDRPARRAHTSR